MQALEYCQQKAAASGSSFLTGFRFLPKQKRDALTVLYAYCRELDDVVDDCSDANVAMTTLNWWQQELLAVFAPNVQPEHPVMQALAAVVSSFGLLENELQDVIDGMRMDLTQARYATYADLQVYCQRVAGSVGRMTARILGFTHPQTLDYADQLGLALQLTNIIRDVGEDARRGRIYLPMTDLQQFDVPAGLILQATGGTTFDALMRFEVTRAQQCYRDAVALLPPADAKAQKVGLILAAIYYALLLEIDRDGAGHVLQYKLAIPGPRKLRIALKTWLWGFHP
ncbi:presqualene diphosphate synthase HpnD [Snodgrassella sp. CFCC 13594]|uniref:presqualene diphosphate synthase HpnD n=1 Tax=Snodgrassella sp. CFCC 13594 TaxID=1775559 RepID=UPI0008365B64|nr:presqualene diphosphate synthase HpnD [Snodgrassella sp. CFCC 13594]